MLEGVRILDFSQALAGPYATLVLADLGADVLKVESPGKGDDTRRWGPPFVNGESAYFLSVNRNKRSVALDLKTTNGLQAARDLARNCDVVMENFRPGTATRLGIGPADLTELDPRLIYCSISGFGQDGGPRAGYDQIIQGGAGLMSITGMPEGVPIKLGVPISDIVSGMFAAHAVLAALYERHLTAKGRVIDIAMQDAVVALLTFQAGRYFATGMAPGREGNHHPTIAPYGMFETADGFINIGVGNDAQWKNFCSALRAPDLFDNSAFATNSDRLAARPELHARVESILKQRPTREWIDEFGAAGVPAGPIRSLDEVFQDPDLLRRDMKVDLDHPTAGKISVTGAPWKFDGASSAIRRPPPLLGEHTAEVLIEVAGYGEQQAHALVDAAGT